MNLNRPETRFAGDASSFWPRWSPRVWRRYCDALIAGCPQFFCPPLRLLQRRATLAMKLARIRVDARHCVRDDRRIGHGRHSATPGRPDKVRQIRGLRLTTPPSHRAFVAMPELRCNGSGRSRLPADWLLAGMHLVACAASGCRSQAHLTPSLEGGCLAPSSSAATTPRVTPPGLCMDI
jgi:hypothetical protein